MMMNQSIPTFVTGLGHFVIDRACLLTDHRMSSFPIRAKYKHFRKIGSILVTILHVLCRVVESSCWPTRNVALHIS